jgi:hypothetical protein
MFHNSIFSDKFFDERKVEIQHFYQQYVENTPQKVETILEWYKDLQSGKVAQRNEEQQTSEFLDKIFGISLGYGSDENRWKLEKEFGFRDESTADGVLGYFEVQKSPIIKVVIEMKKLKINLDKPQMQRPDHFTPVQQAFHYADQVRDSCEWIIVSNFEEIRLYNANDPNRYESFLFSELLESINDTERNLIKKFPNLGKFFYLLHYGNLYNQLKQDDEGALPLTKKLYQYRLKRLEDVSLEFYNGYKKLRKKLNLHIKNKNTTIQLTDSQCFEISNKIFDRLIFMRFSQSVGLINHSIINDYIQFVRNVPTAFPLAWINIKAIFQSFDKGYQNDIPPFNGELFKPIEILEKITIENSILIEIFVFLLSYDFKDELKVDILGHIFEQSISEVTNQTQLENLTVRKRDGVFYTPEYITDFMIQNTLIEYLNNKKNEIYKNIKVDYLSEFEIDLQRWEKQNNEFSRTQAVEKYATFFTRYKEILSTIKILDPACGSGAFLVRVFDYLMKENETTENELEKLEENLYSIFLTQTNPTKTSKKGKSTKAQNLAIFESKTAVEQKKQKKLSEIGRKILLDNLFGVDINFESIEITKLSLWLKTANKNGIPLADLRNNIKMGNSLVENTNIDEKAFEWNNNFEYETFDVIVGNPPYFSLSTQNSKISDFYKEKFKVYERTSDIYCLFFEKALQLLKPKGIVSFITSNQWLQTNYGKTLRNFILENANPTLLINFAGFRIFPDAVVDTSILTLQKEHCLHYLKACIFDKTFQKNANIQTYIQENTLILTDLNADRWTIAENDTLLLKEKIKNAGSKLKDWDIKINYGIKTGLNDAFIIDEQTKNNLIQKDPKSAELLQPILRGRDVHQYHKNWADLYLITTKNGVQIEEYKAVFEHLESFGEFIRNRSDQGENWWNLRACSYYDSFHQEKIIYPETTVRRSEFYLDKTGFYIDKTCFMITGEHLAFLNGILASQLMEWYLETELRNLGKNSIQYSKQYMEEVPLPPKTIIDTNLYKKISEFSERLTVLYQNSVSNKLQIEEIKQNLNACVFELYNLGELEINKMLKTVH